jgi:hypothetical protein
MHSTQPSHRLNNTTKQTNNKQTKHNKQTNKQTNEQANKQLRCKQVIKKKREGKKITPKFWP